MGEHDYEDSAQWVEMTGTMIGNASKNSRKVWIWLDEEVEGKSSSLIRSLWPKDVTPIAGPLREICKGCGLRPVGAPAPENWHCDVCAPWTNGEAAQPERLADVDTGPICEPDPPTAEWPPSAEWTPEDE